MKKLVYAMIIAGTTVCSSIGIMFLGCGSPDQMGASGGGHSGNPGGIAGAPTIKLDGSFLGMGGGAGSGAPPTGDANCGSSTSSTSQEPADVLLVLDRSGSMDWSIAEDCYCDPSKAGGGGQACSDTTNCSPRWPTLTSAVNTTLSNTAGVSWGLKLFSSPGGSNNCTVSTGVEVQIGANSASAIQQQIANTSPGGYTPTAKAISAAKAYLDTITDKSNKVILLATDGEPNCKGTSENTTDDSAGAKAAITAAYTAGYKVYVVGMGPQTALTNLQSFAVAGGTDNYYPADSPEALASALAAIGAQVASCTFSVTAPAQGDTNNVAVYINGDPVPSTGWTYTASSHTVELNGSYCDAIKNATATTVQVYFGCGEPPPPILK